MLLKLIIQSLAQRQMYMHPVRIKLIRNGLLDELANYYTTLVIPMYIHIY